MIKYEISREFVQWESSCSLQVDRQTDGHDEDNIRFTQFLQTRPKMFVSLLNIDLNTE